MFKLDPRLQRDTIELGRFPLCLVLLMNDSSYPWIILVPRCSNLKEIHHMSVADQQQLLTESTQLARWMERFFHFDKLNIAALGNIVSQLHLHHVGRRIGDPAWPGPVWGHRPAVPYAEKEIEHLQQAVRDEFTALLQH